MQMLSVHYVSVSVIPKNWLFRKVPYQLTLRALGTF